MNRSTLLVAAILVGACADEAPSDSTGLVGDPCGAGNGCAEPLVCVDGRCREPCVTANDCALQHVCSEGACLPTSDPCLGDCDDLPHVSAATCDRDAAPPACVITTCDDGWLDVDGLPGNGCEKACTVTGAEICDGEDNDCNGAIDDVAPDDLASECAVANPLAQAVAEWVCTGACAIGTCAPHWHDIDAAAANGCEYGCQPTGAEACDGDDNDCSGAADDMSVTEVNSDCADEYAGAEHVVGWACVLGACALAQCDPGYSDDDGLPETGCEEFCVETNGGVEACDGVDNDCDGSTDNAPAGASGCTDFYVDGDNDGFGSGAGQCLCDPAAPYTAPNPDDCDDSAPSCNVDCATNVDSDVFVDCLDTCIDFDGDGYGAPGGAGDTCIGPDCDDTAASVHPGATEVCNNTDDNCDTAIDGDPALDNCACAAGGAPSSETCGDGIDNDCNDAIDDGCAPGMILPSNLGGVNLCQGTQMFTISSNATIDTDAGTISSFGGPLTTITIDQGAAGPDITVFFFDTLSIEARVDVVGTGALALVACNEVTITSTGVLDLCARARLRGPGGYDGGDMAAAGSGPGAGDAGNGVNLSPFNCSGGGGGGHCGFGGVGGVAGSYDGGPGGGTYGSDTLIPLVGGSGGGGGVACSPGVGKSGGGGGGAVQIVAGATLTIDGVINACGGGGGGPEVSSASGGGGGSGGAILLEAMHIQLLATGLIAANGGGGGGGEDYGDPTTDTSGEDGPPAARRAAGGVGGAGSSPGYAGDGGDGGALTDIQGAHGQSDAADSYSAGGGGGGAGRIRFNANDFTIQGVVSPDDPGCASTGPVSFQ